MVELRLRRENEGERPSDILKGYADLRYSINATSQALGVSRQTVRKLAKRFEVKFKPYRELNDSCRGPVKKARTMNEYLLGYLVDRIREAI